MSSNRIDSMPSLSDRNLAMGKLTREEAISSAIELSVKMAETMDMTPAQRNEFSGILARALRYFVSAALPEFGGQVVTEADFSASEGET